MNKNALYHPYVNEQGKLVSGSAAFSHYVHTVKGGIQQYNDEIGEEYIKAFERENSDAINENIVKKEQKKKRFKRIS